MARTANSANLLIDTNQPIPLNGLVLRGVHSIPVIKTVRIDDEGNERILTVNEDDYDKELHGEKLDKLPARNKEKKAAKKKVIKKDKE